jgi:hypothetical protein
MSIHADDEFSLKMALDWELDDVVPDSRLAGSVISRYRRAVRRRVASAVSVVVALAGIGVPLSVFSRGVQTNPPDPPPATRPAVVSPGWGPPAPQPGDPRSSLREPRSGPSPAALVSLVAVGLPA